MSARQAADCVAVTVTDSGQGMPAGAAARHGEDFWQWTGGSSPRDILSWLGLAIARKLAERQGGRLIVESAPGAGLTLTLHLPADTTSPAAQPRRRRRR